MTSSRYNIPFWGQDYFSVDSEGQLIAVPSPDHPEHHISLVEVTERIRQAGLSLPVLVRFNNILHHRVRSLQKAFAKAIHSLEYQGTYTPVYPIKVNQQRRVVDELLRGGGDHIGLEAGSKPELLAVLGLAPHPGTLIICNGYKDREYIRLALMGQLMGHQVYLILEKEAEVKAVIQEAEAMGVTPRLGIRVRLSSIGVGKWQNTGGEKGKFGLSAHQVLDAVHELKRSGHEQWLQALHVHLGSQIPNIHDIQQGMYEFARYYVQLHEMGIPIQMVDVGGGLGVDYEGTKSRNFCSINYSLVEYAKNIIQPIAELCEQHQLPHPHIVSESGRALTAHHAVLITNIIDRECIAHVHPPKITHDTSKVVKELAHTLHQLNERGPLETYHDACQGLAQSQTQYIHGLISLSDRAQAEQTYWAICRAIQPLLDLEIKAHRELSEELQEKLADKLFVNFSLFQSVPDVWAIDQIFPIVPLSHLNEPLTTHARIHDLTCDSDGCFDWYVDPQGLSPTLNLPEFSPQNPYLLGIFMVGAYQEILGDMHNLFGDTDSVHVEIKPDGTIELQDLMHGDTVSDVLNYIHTNPEALMNSYRQQLANRPIGTAQAQTILKTLEQGLQGYTYLEDEVWGR